MRRLTTLLLTIALFVLPSALAAQKDEIYTPVLSNAAIKGYDPVAYFTDKAPVKGSTRITHDWKGCRVALRV